MTLPEDEVSLLVRIARLPDRAALSSLRKRFAGENIKNPRNLCVLERLRRDVSKHTLFPDDHASKRRRFHTT